jgi:uncharacterized OB-fold protein
MFNPFNFIKRYRLKKKQANCHHQYRFHRASDKQSVWSMKCSKCGDIQYGKRNNEKGSHLQ